MRLRVAITADPMIPVPPRAYGGIERVVHFLVEGLVARGHDVTLFARAGSRVPCRLEPYPDCDGRPRLQAARNAAHVGRRLLAGGFDLVHSFGRLAYLAAVLPLPGPKIMSYQRRITPSRVRWASRVARGTLHVTVCSRSLLEPAAPVNGSVAPMNGRWHVVPNGIPIATYAFRSSVPAAAPLVFLGRMEEIKGPHLAIDVAARSGRDLILAGNLPGGWEHADFFRSRIAPRLDGRRVRYLGPVDDAAKSGLLGGAAALLMPVLWDEPFGIVMAEALACGTPVVALGRGAVPEVVESGVTGFVCDSVDEMVASVARLGAIDRGSCRQAAEERFSDRVIVDAYLDLYARVLGR